MLQCGALYEAARHRDRPLCQPGLSKETQCRAIHSTGKERPANDEDNIDQGDQTDMIRPKIVIPAPDFRTMFS